MYMYMHMCMHVNRYVVRKNYKCSNATARDCISSVKNYIHNILLAQDQYSGVTRRFLACEGAGTPD